MSKTYLVGKIGKSVKFDPQSWGAIGGDNESPTLLRRMAELNPDDTFIIIGRNDVEKNRAQFNIPTNIRDVYEGASATERKDNMYIVRRLNGVQIDGCFLLTGPTANVNIPEKSWKRTLLKTGVKEHAKVLETFRNYVGPVYQYLNESKIPWIMIANDPRYISQGNDLENLPQLILSQYDETIEMQNYDNWVDQNYMQRTIKSVYAGMEKIFLLDKSRPAKNDRHIQFMMVLNEGNNGVKSRYPMLKEYVLDSMTEVEIYGQWDPETIGADKRFKGPKKFEELQKILTDVKYTLIIPIKPGWVTSKWVEMIANGIIPFFHPTYDEQRHCKVPDYVRLQKPSDLAKKIAELESDPAKYTEVLSQCIAALSDDDFTGVSMSKTILNSCPAFNQTGKQFYERKNSEAGEATQIESLWA